ncbi:hypothetical protein KW798_02605 [Candidatus Parcubacteria bacterium]|nr:hypothetical protein [Candidatus Parcubacteria bacterium]
MNDFKKRSFSSAGPKREFRKPRFGGSFKRDSGAPIELYDATCANCHKACQVPFRPNGKKPVFCKDCFEGNKDDSMPAPRTYSRPHREERGSNDLQSQIEQINAKLDTLTRLVKSLAE